MKVFVYGTLKSSCANHHLLNDTNNGIAEYVCSATTKEKYPLVVATDFYLPFLLNKPGVGHVSYLFFVIFIVPQLLVNNYIFLTYSIKRKTYKCNLIFNVSLINHLLSQEPNGE